MRWIVIFAFLSVVRLSRAEEIPPAPSSPSVESLTLDECVAWTLVRHPRLAEAGFLIDQSRGMALQAGLYPNPRLDSGNPQTIGPQRTSVLDRKSVV